MPREATAPLMPLLQLRDVPSRGTSQAAPGSSPVETEITSVHCSKPPRLW